MGGDFHFTNGFGMKYFFFGWSSGNELKIMEDI